MTTRPPDFRALSCSECVDGADLDFDFTMAFQPIVDVSRKKVYAQEALVRGPDPASPPAAEVFRQVNDGNR